MLVSGEWVKGNRYYNKQDVSKYPDNRLRRNFKYLKTI